MSGSTASLRTVLPPATLSRMGCSLVLPPGAPGVFFFGFTDSGFFSWVTPDFSQASRYCSNCFLNRADCSGRLPVVVSV